MTITFDALKFGWKQQTVDASSIPSIQGNDCDASLNLAESPQEAAVGSSAKATGNSVGKASVHKEATLMVDAKESEWSALSVSTAVYYSMKYSPI